MLHMAKMYIKDQNGKYRLVDRDRKIAKEKELTVEERLLRLERIVLDPRK